MKKVFVVGSLNMDLVIRTPIFPREGETVLGQDFFLNPGGKGANQAVASAKQGAPTYLLGATGNDLFGKQIKEGLTNYGVNSILLKTKDAPTGVAMIVLHNGDNRIIVSPGANYEYTLDEAKDDLKTHSKPGDILVLQLEIKREIVEELIPFAKKLGLFVIFNPAPMCSLLDSKVLKDVDLLIMNEWEAKALTKSEKESLNTGSILEKLVTLGVKDVIITLGAKGGVFVENGKIAYYDAFKSIVVDTTGAGDSFVGSLAAFLVNDESLHSAINKASYVAAITVSRKGAQQAIPTKAEVSKYYQEMKEKHAR